MSGHRRTLVLAWGNPARADDGLGIAFADALDRLRLPRVTVVRAAHPSVEHAALLPAFDRVLFADADRAGPVPFRLVPIAPTRDGSGFSTHGSTPGAILALATDLYGATPDGWLLGVRGETFDLFREGLSAPARAHLALAVDRVARDLRAGRLHGFDGTGPPERRDAAPEVRR